VALQLRPELVSISLQASTKNEVLLELAQMISSAHPQLRADELCATLKDRESLGSTGIGDGIAIPHGKLAGLKSIEICFGRSLKGIPFDSHDGKPARLFFLLLAPLHSAGPYLHCLAHLSRCLKSSQIRTRLLGAENTREIIEIFAEEKALS